MSAVAVSHLEPNAVLAKPVLDVKGRILLQEGVVLTAQLVALLERWNVITVYVRDESEAAAPRAKTARDWQRLENQDCAEMQIFCTALRAWSARRGQREELSQSS